jgi:glutamate/tyrosine decarboxylase-like PLP-dependent enzyme
LADPERLKQAWDEFLVEALDWEALVREWRVAPRATPADLRVHLYSRFDLARGMPVDTLFLRVREELRAALTHVTHPRYFGLFNPSVRPAAVLGDALASLYNAQLAAWGHGAAAIELERIALETLGRAIGFEGGAERGFHATFTTGGNEANLSALQCALAQRYPQWSAVGARGLPPTRIYVSELGHHSILKSARMSGLGDRSVLEIPCDARQRMDPAALQEAIATDRAEGIEPMMVVATAGTTGFGSVDPLPTIGGLARGHGAWFHVDAAWGGAASLSKRLRETLAGIGQADSVTWDAHKWLSVPIGAGMFFCKHPAAAARAFAVETGYMPPAAGAPGGEPYAVTAQWTRRALGLKVVMALGELGLEGYARLIDRQADLGDALRKMLRDAGWEIVNDTLLPVVCFTNDALREGRPEPATVVERIQQRGDCWISALPWRGEPVLRACITSYQTTELDLEALLRELAECARP